MNKKSTGLLFLACCAFGAFLIYRGVSAAYEGAVSGRWPATPGQISRSAAYWDWARTGIRNNVLAYRLDLAYDYDVQGRRYQGQRVSFSSWDPKTSLNLFNGWTAQRYPVGARVAVYFDPHDPANSVIEPGIRASAWTAVLLGMILIWIGFRFRYVPPGAAHSP